MNMAFLDQILDKGVCISHRVNILEKGMYPIILSPALDR